MTGKKAMAVNPFHIQGRINDLKLFYGRNKELSTIWGFLRNDMNVSIVGNRQLGKSSLLWYIKEKANEVLKDAHKPRPEVFYFDMETIRSEEEFFDGLAKELKLKEKHPTSRELERKLEGKRVILCLDEFDRTAHNDKFSDDFFGILRGLTQGENLTLVVATKIPLMDYSEDGMTSPLYNIFPRKPITLGPFAKEEAEELLRGIASFGEKEFSAADLKRALETVEDYYPWNVQYMGWCWFESEFDMEKAREMYRGSLEYNSGEIPSTSQRMEGAVDTGLSPGDKSSDWITYAAVILTFLLVIITFYTIIANDKGMVYIDIILIALVASLAVLHSFKTGRKKR